LKAVKYRVSTADGGHQWAQIDTDDVRRFQPSSRLQKGKLLQAYVCTTKYQGVA